jgi:hypothetical protein
VAGNRNSLGAPYLVAAVVTLLAAACGSSGKSTITVTTGSAAGGADLQAPFTAYLNALKPLRDSANDASKAAKPALNAVSQNATAATAATAASAVRKAAATTAALAPKVAAVVQPSGLANAQQAYAEAFQNEADDMRALATDVQNLNVSGIQADSAQLSAVRRQVATWKTAVIAYAAAHHLTYPTWVTTVGNS